MYIAFRFITLIHIDNLIEAFVKQFNAHTMTYKQKSIEIYKKLVYAYEDYKKVLYVNHNDTAAKKCIWEDLHKTYVEFNKYIKEKNLDSKEYELD